MSIRRWAMFQFSYLPYFPVDNIDVKVGRLHLFNFWRCKDTYIPDQRLKDRIEQMCNLYFEVDFNPESETGLKRLNSITLAVIDDNYSFTPLSDELLADLRNYTLALSFSSLVKNSREGANYHSNCISEHFTTFHQNLDFDSTGISYSSGSYIHINQIAEVNRTRFIKPQFVPGNVLYSFAANIFTALASMIAAHNANDKFILEVLNWVNYAFMNAEGYNYPSRCVMMATAFEALFKLKGDKTRGFSENLESLLDVGTLIEHDSTGHQVGTGLPRSTKPDGRGDVRRYGDGRRGVPGTPIDLTMYGWWARDFYKLRSQIVHTGISQRSDFLNHNDVQHLEIALQVMNACLFKWLDGHGYLIYTGGSESWVNDARKRVDFDDLHRKIEPMIR
jgi:hypothetical protein